MTLQWRHNERDGVSSHLRINCLLNCWLRRRSNETSKLRVTGLCVWEIQRWPVKNPHKRPVTRKCFHFMMSPWRNVVLLLVCKNVVVNQSCRTRYLFCHYDVELINSSSPSAAYMRQWIRSALVQILAWCRIGDKPLSKLMLGYCQLDPYEQTSVKFQSKHKFFNSRKCIWKYRLRNYGHFVQGKMS